MKVKKFKLAEKLIGQVVPDSTNGHAGRYTEKLLVELGVPINFGHGPDIEEIGLEVKTRNLNATSPQTVADMNPEDIISTEYKDSHVYKKFQQQLRVYIRDNVIVSADVYDFSAPAIQFLIKRAYDHARAQIIQNPELTRTAYKSEYGYFERVSNQRRSLSFRLSNDDMATLEGMAKSEYKNLFEDEFSL